MKSLLRALIMSTVTLTANTANAGSLTYSVDVNTVTQDGFLPEFNPTMGQLSSIDVVANVMAGGDFIFQNPVSSVEVSADVELLAIPPTGPAFVFAYDIGNAVTENFSTPTYGIDPEININTTYSISGNWLNSFYGTDVLNVQADPFVVVYDQDAQEYGYPFAVGSLMVTYNFVDAGVPDPPGAPEPSSILMIGIGMIVVLGCRIRKRN